MTIVAINHIKPNSYRKLTTNLDFYEQYYLLGDTLYTEANGLIYWNDVEIKLEQSAMTTLSSNAIAIDIERLHSRSHNFGLARVVCEELGLNQMFYQANTDDYKQDERSHCNEHFDNYKYTKFEYYPQYIQHLVNKI